MGPLNLLPWDVKRLSFEELDALEEGRQIRHQGVLRLVAKIVWWLVTYAQGVDSKTPLSVLDVARSLPGFKPGEGEQIVDEA